VSNFGVWSIGHVLVVVAAAIFLIVVGKFAFAIAVLVAAAVVSGVFLWANARRGGR